MPTLEAVREDLDNAAVTLDQLRSAMRGGEEVDLDAFNLKIAETLSVVI